MHFFVSPGALLRKYPIFQGPEVITWFTARHAADVIQTSEFLVVQVQASLER